MEQDNFDILSNDILPNDWTRKRALIKVIGVGGGGCNAVEYMYNQGVKGCEFIVCNTDSQALGNCSVPLKIQLGEGLGAGCNPTEGRNAALNSQDVITDKLFSSTPDMLFITAGMGGGTGTGAAPVIASMARERNILTVGVVTIPFRDDGVEAMTKAQDGISELEKNVDSLVVIDNEKLYSLHGDLLYKDALPKVDEVLCTAVKGIVDIISVTGHINVDFRDVKTMMTNSGMAIMGYGEGRGENRTRDAVKTAFESPLLNDHDLKTAQNVLLNITMSKGEQGLTTNEMQEIDNLITDYIGNANRFKKGVVMVDDPEMGDRVTITAIATGFDIAGIGDDGDENTIVIPPDYRYDRSGEARDGNPQGGRRTQKVGFNTRVIIKPRNFGKAEKPALAVDMQEDRTRLETEPAIRRRQPKKE